MGSTTTKLSLYKPAVDEEDWGASVNANFDTLDDAIVTLFKNVVSITTDLNVTSEHQVILADMALEVAYSINLPAASASAGQTLFIKLFQDGDGTVLTIHRNGSDAINSVTADLTATAVNSYVILISDGVDGWHSFGISGFA